MIVRPFQTPLRAVLLSSAARPLRFAGTGVVAGLVQLCVLASLTRHGWGSLPANLAAFMLAAQVNFALSCIITWHDRDLSHSWRRRWLMYHASIAAMALLNLAVFLVARPFIPALSASALGIVAGALGNYLSGDRLVFRPASSSPSRSLAA